MCRTLAASICAAALLVVTAPARAGAQGPQDKRTYFTFSHPIALPGVTLKAGTYMFRIANPWNRRDHLKSLESARNAEAISRSGTTDRPIDVGDFIGSLESTSLGLSATVVEGDTAAVLRTGVGHLPDTPLPCQDGNSALAGHRDRFFRSLMKVRPGDHFSLRMSDASIGIDSRVRGHDPYRSRGAESISKEAGL